MPTSTVRSRKKSHTVRVLPTSLTLPDELTLLLHKPRGSYYTSTAARTTLALARIGELALRHRISLTKSGTAPEVLLELIDSSTSGVPWMDTVLGDLNRRTRQGTTTAELSAWLANQTGNLRTHRRVLMAHGLLRQEPKRFLGVIPDDRFYPEQTTRTELLEEIRGVLRGGPLDNRIALLCALIRRTGTGRALGYTPEEQARLQAISDGVGLGENVDAVVSTTVRTVIAPTIMVGAAP